MEQPKKMNTTLASLIVVVLLSVATVGVASISKDEQAQEPTQSPSVNIASQNKNSEKSTAYKDGTYSSQGKYITPGGRESIGLTVTLKAGAIENVELDQQASGGDTAIYQRKFASGYKAEVIGRSIDEVKLERVAGSSLTSNGFNDALDKIKTDATS